MKTNKPTVIVLLGPTASGKTKLGIEIAEFFNLKIHNIDSRQFYLGMDVGTAKPTQIQKKKIEHHLIDICLPNQQITLHDFKRIALESLEKTFNNNEIGLLVGGSGMYLKALTSGFVPPPIGPQTFFRNQLNKITQEDRHKLLEICDPKSANKIHLSDTSRTIRALEVFYGTGKAMSSQTKKKPPNWRTIELGLNPKNLNERIETRTNYIFENGIIEETKKLISSYGEDLPLLKTIGYEESLSVIQRSISISEAIKITNQRTKNFAKRQKTWFKNQHAPKWLNDENPLKEAIKLIQEVIDL